MSILQVFGWGGCLSCRPILSKYPRERLGGHCASCKSETCCRISVMLHHHASLSVRHQEVELWNCLHKNFRYLSSGILFAAKSKSIFVYVHQVGIRNCLFWLKREKINNRFLWYLFQLNFGFQMFHTRFELLICYSLGAWVWHFT